MMPVFPSPPPKIPYGGFSPVRLQGQPVRPHLPASRPGYACSPHARAATWCVSPFARVRRRSSMCGSAEAARETFPPFAAALSTRAVDRTPVGPRRRPVARLVTRLPRPITESPLPVDSAPTAGRRRAIRTGRPTGVLMASSFVGLVSRPWRYRDRSFGTRRFAVQLAVKYSPMSSDPAMALPLSVPVKRNDRLSPWLTAGRVANVT